MVNFSNIRLYGREYTPDYFKGHGLRGWWVRVLNALREYLEGKVRYHALMIIGIPLEDYHAPNIEHIRREMPRIIRDAPNYPDVTPVAISMEPEDQQRAAFARLGARGRPKRYTRGRHTHPIFEAEERPNASEPETADEGPVQK